MERVFLIVSRVAVVVVVGGGCCCSEMGVRESVVEAVRLC